MKVGLSLSPNFNPIHPNLNLLLRGSVKIQTVRSNPHAWVLSPRTKHEFIGRLRREVSGFSLIRKQINVYYLFIVRADYSGLRLLQFQLEIASPSTSTCLRQELGIAMTYWKQRTLALLRPSGYTGLKKLYFRQWRKQFLKQSISRIRGHPFHRLADQIPQAFPAKPVLISLFTRGRRLNLLSVLGYTQNRQKERKQAKLSINYRSCHTFSLIYRYL